MRRTAKPVILLAALWALVLLVCVQASKAAEDTDKGTSQPVVSDDPETQLLTLVNQDRAQQGLKPLLFDVHLQAAARNHAQQMQQHGSLSHQFAGEPALTQRLAAAGARFDAAAENVADAPSAADADQALMHSPGHRANILNPDYTAVGVGMAYGVDRLYFTEDFSHQVPQLTSNELEDAVYQQVNRARSAHGQMPLERVNVPMLRTEACKDEVNVPALAKSFALVGWVVVFTTSNPQEPPAAMMKAAQQGAARKLAVGACYPASSQQNFSLFKVVAVLFR